MQEFSETFIKYFYGNPLIIVFIIIGIICAIIGKQIIGWFGEHWTKKELNKLPKNKYVVINDVFIKVNDRTCQIDHIVVSKYGIFSIETKQYNGYITGDKYDKKWIRHLGKRKLYYTNPIRQNYGHVKSLSELLSIDESKVYNIVCIPSTAKLKIKHDGELVRNYDIVDKILSYKEEEIANVDEIVNIINKNNIKDKKVRKEHVKNIKENIITKDDNTCPKCGGQLVERTSQYGKFIGCSNYPKCKYIK